MKKIITTIATVATLLFGISKTNAQINILKNFNYANGANPYGSLISNGTYLYGMTSNGTEPNEDGNIFKIKPDGTGFDTLLSFNGTNGAAPQGSLIYDGTYLYGMTQQGGYYGNGTIFKIKPDGSGFDTLMSFNNQIGSGPSGSLLLLSDTLFGMTVNGGYNNDGTIFKIKTDGTGFDTLFNFNNGTSGNQPNGTLITDGTWLYGMTSNGGINNNGTVFKIKTNGTSFDTLTSFNASSTNGYEPYGSLLLINDTLYGMTSGGGVNGDGNIFKIDTGGVTIIDLFDFNYPNGNEPYGSLITDGTYLYGMTNSGGINNDGNIFKIKTDGTGFVDIADFNGTNGQNTPGDLLLQGGFLYGMTPRGGTNNDGVIFSLCSNPPLVTVSSATTIVAGNTTTLTVSGTATSYTWSIGATANTITVSPSVTTIYTVTGANSTCTAMALDTVEVIGPGAALNFDGVDDIVLVNTGSNSLTAPFTIEAWVNPNNVSSTLNILSTRGPSDQSFDFKLMNGNKIHGDIGDGSGWLNTNADGSYSYNAGQWMHVAYVVTNTDYNIYANGVLIGNGSISGTPLLFDANHTITIGGLLSGGENFAGSIDEVRVWGNARTQCQINNSMNCELAPSDRTGLVAYYKFNEGITLSNNATVTAATDSSGNGNNGTLNNFALTGATSNWSAPGGVATGVSCGPIVYPTVSVNSATICAGATTTLTANSSTATSYSWSTGDATTSITQSPTVTASYTVTGMGANNCMTSAISTVTVNNPTSATVNPTGCINVMVNATTYTATGVYTQTLTNAAGCDSVLTINATINMPTTATITPSGCNSVVVNAITYTASGTYTQTYTNSVGCDSTLTIIATISMPTTATISPVGCTSLTVNATTYTASGTYTQTFTNSVGCDSTLTINATINSIPNVTINGSVSNSLTLCYGATGTLTAGGATSYTWMPINSNMNTISGTVTTSISFTLTGTDANGCTNTATTDVTVNTLPTLTITASSPTVCASGTTTLTVSGATSYTWANTDAMGSTISDSPTMTTNYTVTGTDGNGCMNSDTLSVIVNNCNTTGITHLAAGSEVSVYPNPNNGSFVVTTTENATTLIITDVLGNELLFVTPTGTTTNVNLSAQPNGVYFIKVIANGEQTVKRMVINN